MIMQVYSFPLSSFFLDKYELFYFYFYFFFYVLAIKQLKSQNVTTNTLMEVVQVNNHDSSGINPLDSNPIPIIKHDHYGNGSNTAVIPSS